MAGHAIFRWPHALARVSRLSGASSPPTACLPSRVWYGSPCPHGHGACPIGRPLALRHGVESSCPLRESTGGFFRRPCRHEFDTRGGGCCTPPADERPTSPTTSCYVRKCWDNITNEPLNRSVRSRTEEDSKRRKILQRERHHHHRCVIISFPFLLIHSQPFLRNPSPLEANRLPPLSPPFPKRREGVNGR